jgi:hypothetical protein
MGQIMRKTLLLQSVLLIGVQFLFMCPIVSGADLIIKLESYIPLEKCSMRFSVFSDGSAKYKGKHCSERSIHIRPHLSVMEVNSIQELKSEVQFCELRNDYSADNNNQGYVVMDSETLKINAYCGNNIRSVSVYGIDHMLETKIPNTEHSDRDAVRCFDKLNHYVFELLIL